MGAMVLSALLLQTANGVRCAKPGCDRHRDRGINKNKCKSGHPWPYQRKKVASADESDVFEEKCHKLQCTRCGWDVPLDQANAEQCSNPRCNNKGLNSRGSKIQDWKQIKSCGTDTQKRLAKGLTRFHCPTCKDTRILLQSHLHWRRGYYNPQHPVTKSECTSLSIWPHMFHVCWKRCPDCLLRSHDSGYVVRYQSEDSYLIESPLGELAPCQWCNQGRKREGDLGYTFFNELGAKPSKRQFEKNADVSRDLLKEHNRRKNEAECRILNDVSTCSDKEESSEEEVNYEEDDNVIGEGDEVYDETEYDMEEDEGDEEYEHVN